MFSCKEYKIVQSHKHPANSQKISSSKTVSYDISKNVKIA